jgi:hypothetical protein
MFIAIDAFAYRIYAKRIDQIGHLFGRIQLHQRNVANIIGVLFSERRLIFLRLIK